MTKKLCHLIELDKNKCLNCHGCISACPVKFCNDGSGDYIKINSDLCIGCGQCIKACTHNARNIIDDFEEFMMDLAMGNKMVALVAPSVAVNFPNQYMNFNGWLKSIGVSAIFDVSFGAELTVKSYMEYIKSNNPKMIIAQPCPAIVTYIQIYQPQLIDYLAPLDSPMLHTAKMVREFYPQFKEHKIAFISPCIAKKREFEETGLGDYNITFHSLKKYFDDNNIALSSFQEINYYNPPPERAVLFSTPGGLLRTAERWNDNIKNITRKIEGPERVYKYLSHLPEMLKQGYNPLLIDCLSCELGCNEGTATGNDNKSPDELEILVEKRNMEIQKKHRETVGDNSYKNNNLEDSMDKYWEKNLYKRNYENLSGNIDFKSPAPDDLEKIYALMEKYSDKDIYNCSACGYGTCEGMATAIYNGLNKHENCHHYLAKIREKTLTELEEVVNYRTEELKVANEKLYQSQKMEAIGTLAGGIAHDFNNILSPIIGYTEMMLNHLSSNDVTMNNYLHRILSAGHRAKELVGQILTFSRENEEERKPLIVYPIISEAVKLLRASIPSTIEIREKISAKNSMISGDPTQIYQILINLCTNSFHSMKEKGGFIEINLIDTDIYRDDIEQEDLAPGSYVRLSVTDNGCGMEKSVMDRIFEPYFTTKNPGEGTGFGLALVYGIVKKHEGEIRVFSKQGEGTTFHIYFPRIKNSKISREKESHIIPTGSESILVVDDEKYLMEMMESLLNRLGYKVTACGDSLKALEKFRENPGDFHLVITDQTMPGFTGTELSKELLQAKPDIPIILCSGYSESITLEEIKSIGIREFISKPINIRNLAETIRRVIDG